MAPTFLRKRRSSAAWSSSPSWDTMKTARWKSCEMCIRDRTKTLRLEIPPESFRYWREGEGWHALSQPRTLLLGFSSEDLPLGIQIQ